MAVWFAGLNNHPPQPKRNSSTGMLAYVVQLRARNDRYFVSNRQRNETLPPDKLKSSC
jgi:hypothetical protein